MPLKNGRQSRKSPCDPDVCVARRGRLSWLGDGRCLLATTRRWTLASARGWTLASAAPSRPVTSTSPARPITSTSPAGPVATCAALSIASRTTLSLAPRATLSLAPRATLSLAPRATLSLASRTTLSLASRATLARSSPAVLIRRLLALGCLGQAWYRRNGKCKCHPSKQVLQERAACKVDRSMNHVILLSSAHSFTYLTPGL
jgi:hypothetical protein